MSESSAQERRALTDRREPPPGWGRPNPGMPWSPAEAAPALPPGQVAVPVAWLGRTSTEDQQDPTLSLPRQLRNARAALQPG
jgi:site-specific DNA recombinase